MTTTKITPKEFIELSQQIELARPVKQPPQTQYNTPPNTEILNLDRIKRILKGSRNHQRIAWYIIKLLRQHKFGYNTEVRIYLPKIDKVYVIDIIARKGGKKIAIECGNANKYKLGNLKDYFDDVIHISYRQFKVMYLGKGITQMVRKRLGIKDVLDTF